METTSFPTIHVAYCDDHDLIREGVSNIIYKRSLMMPVDTIVVDIQARDGVELIEKLSTAAHLPDVCMVDINMPRMNGFDTIREIRSRWPQMGVLVFTIFDLEQYVIRMIMSGANGYLVKNSGAEQLVVAIVAIHKTGMYYPDLATKHFYERIRTGQVLEPEISPAERQFLSHLAAGMRYDMVAQKMGISMLELEQLRDELSTRLRVNSRAGLVLFAVQTGIVPLEIDTSGLAVQ